MPAGVPLRQHREAARAAATTPPAARSSTGPSSWPTPGPPPSARPSCPRRRSAAARDEYRVASRLHRPRPRRRRRPRSSTQECRDARRDVPHDGGPARRSTRSGSSCGSSAEVGARRCAASSTASSSTRRRARRHRLQDRPGAVGQLGAEEPGRRALLLLPVRAGARPPPGRHPADVPAAAARPSRPRRRSSRCGSSPPARTAVWQAVERACVTGDFRPRPSALCASCASSSGARRSAATPTGPPSRRRALAAWRDVPIGATPRRRRARTGADRRRRPPRAPRSPSRSGPAVDRFDRWADDALERLRGNPVADAVFIVGHHARRLQPDLAPRQRRPRARPATGGPTRSPVLALALGAESLLVNQGLKRLFRPAAPDRRGRPPLPGAPPADVVVPERPRQRRGVRGRRAHGWDGRRIGAAVVDARRRRGDEPGLRAHPPRLRRRRRAWPPAPCSALAARRILPAPGNALTRSSR